MVEKRCLTFSLIGFHSHKTGKGVNDMHPIKKYKLLASTKNIRLMDYKKKSIRIRCPFCFFFRSQVSFSSKTHISFKATLTLARLTNGKKTKQNKTNALKTLKLKIMYLKVVLQQFRKLSLFIHV